MMEILVPHVGADFDAFAAIVVARRFHPEARLAGGLEVLELRQKDVDPLADPLVASHEIIALPPPT